MKTTAFFYLPCAVLALELSPFLLSIKKQTNKQPPKKQKQLNPLEKNLGNDYENNSSQEKRTTPLRLEIGTACCRWWRWRETRETQCWQGWVAQVRRDVWRKQREALLHDNFNVFL